MAGAEVFGILDGNDQHPVGTLDPDLGAAPVLRQPGADQESAAAQAEAEDTFDGELPSPARGAGVPSLSGLADVGIGAVHVAGQDIGFGAVEVRAVWIGAAANRVDQIENRVGTVALAEPRVGQTQPGHRMGVLAVVFAHARRIARMYPGSRGVRSNGGVSRRTNRVSGSTSRSVAAPTAAAVRAGDGPFASAAQDWVMLSTWYSSLSFELHGSPSSAKARAYRAPSQPAVSAARRRASCARPPGVRTTRARSAMTGSSVHFGGSGKKIRSNDCAGSHSE